MAMHVCAMEKAIAVEQRGNANNRRGSRVYKFTSLLHIITHRRVFSSSSNIIYGRIIS